MTPTPTSERVAVEQVDRAAAATIAGWFRANTTRYYVAGQLDDRPLIQLLARHRLAALSARPDPVAEEARAFAIGDRVRKRSGSSWQGRVVGFYSTSLTPIGYAVESEREPGSVQIYPEAALAAVSD